MICYYSYGYIIFRFSVSIFDSTDFTHFLKYCFYSINIEYGIYVLHNPLEGLAEEKLREINEAYDYIMKFEGNDSFTRDSGGFGASSEFAQR